MDENLLKSLSPEAVRIMNLVQGDELIFKSGVVTTQGLFDIEESIQFHLKWLNAIDLNQAQKPHPFIVQKIKNLLLLNAVYNTLVPENQIIKSVQTLIDKIPDAWLHQIDNLKIIDTPPPPTQHKSYPKWLFYGAELNRGRLDISSCLALVNACFIYSRSDYTQNHPLPYVANINFSLGMVSFILPFINLGTLIYQFHEKYLKDLEADFKTLQSDMFFLQKRQTFYKNLINLTLNVTTFLIDILNLFPMNFYFAFLNIGIDFIFYCWDFYDKHIHFLRDREQQYQLIQFENVKMFDEYVKNNSQERIHYLTQLYKDVYSSQVPNKEEKLFHIISLISAEQKYANSQRKLQLEMATLFIMFGVLIVAQNILFPGLNPELTFMTGLLMLYIYHGLKSLLIENPIVQLKQSCIKLKNINHETIYLKGGKISKDPSSNNNSYFNLEVLQTLGIKIALPVLGLIMLQFTAPQLAIPLFLAIALCIKLFELASKTPPTLEAVKVK